MNRIRENLATVPAELASPPPDERPRNLLARALLGMRIAFVAATSALVGVNFNATLLLIDWPDIPLKRAAITSGYPMLVEWLFVLSLALSVPFLVTQIFCPACKLRWWFTKAACGGHFLAGMLWCGLAILSTGIDFGFYGIALGINGMMNVTYAVVLALAFNHELLRLMGRARR